MMTKNSEKSFYGKVQQDGNIFGIIANELQIGFYHVPAIGPLLKNGICEIFLHPDREQGFSGLKFKAEIQMIDVHRFRFRKLGTNWDDQPAENQS